MPLHGLSRYTHCDRGSPLNLFRIKISDNEDDDATAADATAADDEDDDCDNDYTHSITNYY